MSAVTAEQLDGLRGRLRSFCYQTLGSPFDAEDAVQDVLERAWRAREQYDEARSSVTTWCFRIARNVCIDRLRETGRRPLPRDLQEPGIDIGAPLVPALDVPWLMPAPAGWSGGSAPVPAWSRGVEQYRDFMAQLFLLRGTAWATRVVAVSGGQPGLLLYAAEGGRRIPHTVQLFSADETGAIGHVLVYRDERLFALFEKQSSAGAMSFGPLVRRQR